jgi:hypothetical protein
MGQGARYALAENDPFLAENIQDRACEAQLKLVLRLDLQVDRPETG